MLHGYTWPEILGTSQVIGNSLSWVPWGHRELSLFMTCAVCHLLHHSPSFFSPSVTSSTVMQKSPKNRVFSSTEAYATGAAGIAICNRSNTTTENITLFQSNIFTRSLPFFHNKHKNCGFKITTSTKTTISAKWEGKLRMSRMSLRM